MNEYRGGVPFLVTKGNHDITGPGAPRAYNDAVLGWLGRQLSQKIASASYAVSFGPDRFIFFDSFNPDLDWLEKTLTAPVARYTFMVTHEPVVPFDARSNWHLLVNDPAQRDRLLNLLGRHKVVVLCGHLHKFSILRRNTPGGSFLQIAMNSVVSNLNASAENIRFGVADYGPDLVNLEPSFAPDTLELRRHILENEKPFVESFEYAKTSGFCLLKADPDTPTVELHIGASLKPYQIYSLSLN